MRHEDLATQKLLAQCRGLHSWLQATHQQEPARTRLERELGDRLFDAIVGGLTPRR
jgi:hypothetical protein